MIKTIKIFFFASLLILQGCFVYGEKKMLSLTTTIKKKEDLGSTLTSVNVSNNQVTINGRGLGKATIIKITGTNVDADLTINSKSDSQIIATATNALSLIAGGAFNLIIGTVDAQATYPITFTLQNGAVQAAHLASMGASTGQILKFNGTNWGPSNLSSSQLYRGTYDAATDSPSLGATAPVAGDYYIVTVAGIQNSISYPVNSWIMYNGTDWEKISNDAPVVSSFKGRRGLVVPLKGDYNLGLMTDVDLSGGGIPAADMVLTYDASGKWIAKALPAVNAGSVTNVTGTSPISVATGSSTPVVSISQATTSTNGFVSSTDWNTFNGKQANIVATTSADYYRGDKTFQTLNTSAVPEFGATNIYFSNARALGVSLTAIDVTLTGAITSSDNILSAFGRTQYQLSNLDSNSSAYVTKTTLSAVSGTVDARTGFVLVGTPGTLDDATPKSYVDTALATSVAKSGDSMSGDLTLNTQLKLKNGGAANYITLKAPTAGTTAYSLSLPSSPGSSNQVLITDGAGATSWSTPSTSATPTGSAAGDLAGTYPNPTIASGLAATKIADGSVTDAQFQYVSGATSNIQTQLNGKATSSLASTNIFVGNGSGVATAVALSGDAALSNAGELTLNTVTVAKGGTGSSTTLANYIFAGPTAVGGAPLFRALVAADLPTGTLAGSGTTNYVPYYSAASTLANSPIAISGSKVGIGITLPARALNVVGNSTSGTLQLRLDESNTGNTYTGIELFNQGASKGSLFSTAANTYLNNLGGGSIILRSTGSGTGELNITNAGNVGIGVSGPVTKLQVAGIISPEADATRNLGTSSLRFKDIYASNNVIQTSDARLKKDVQGSDLGLEFINKLRPVSYYWKQGDDKKLHYGLIAQETENIMFEAKQASGRQDEVDNVIVTHDEKNDRYGIRYTELISPLIKAVQELFSEVKALIARVMNIEKKLEEKANKLEAANAAKSEEIRKLNDRLNKIEKIMMKNK